MPTDNNSSEADDNKRSLIEMSTMIYGVMTIVGISICLWGHGNLNQLISMPETNADISRLLTLAGLGLGILLIGNYFFEYWFQGYRDLRSAMMLQLGQISVPGSLYLALTSAIGEEILFRGAIQPYAGLVMTSLLFGLLHLGPGGRVSSWSIWAVLSGLLLGGIVSSSQSILPAIAIHFGVNGISILSLRRDWLKLSDSEKLELEKVHKAPETSQT